MLFFFVLELSTSRLVFAGAPESFDGRHPAAAASGAAAGAASAPDAAASAPAAPGPFAICFFIPPPRYSLLPCFTGFHWLLLAFARLYWGLTRFYLVLPSFTGSYWVLLSFTGSV